MCINIERTTMKLNEIDHRVLSHWADNYKAARRMLRAKIKKDRDEYYKFLDKYNAGPSDCAYCNIHYLHDDINPGEECMKCPIRLLDTAFEGCEKTPYGDILIPKRPSTHEVYSFENVTVEILENLVIDTSNEYFFLKIVLENNKKNGIGYEN